MDSWIVHSFALNILSKIKIYVHARCFYNNELNLQIKLTLRGT